MSGVDDGFFSWGIFFYFDGWGLLLKRCLFCCSISSRMKIDFVKIRKFLHFLFDVNVGLVFIFAYFDHALALWIE